MKEVCGRLASSSPGLIITEWNSKVCGCANDSTCGMGAFLVQAYKKGLKISSLISKNTTS